MDGPCKVIVPRALLICAHIPSQMRSSLSSPPQPHHTKLIIMHYTRPPLTRATSHEPSPPEKKPSRNPTRHAKVAYRRYSSQCMPSYRATADHHRLVVGWAIAHPQEPLSRTIASHRPALMGHDHHDPGKMETLDSDASHPAQRKREKMQLSKWIKIALARHRCIPDRIISQSSDESILPL